ncbi:hypothetical protein ACS0TY_026470 [Phlomoides rotata]
MVEQRRRPRGGTGFGLEGAEAAALKVTVRESIKKALPWKSSIKSKNEGAFLKECDI